jgi:uncharacterized protein
MGRNCINRLVEFVPMIKGFHPFGMCADTKQQISLSLDEFEVIRLLDYLSLSQEEAAQRMQISRPTLTRIYEKARTKFSTALVEGCSLVIEGGNVQLQNHRYHCPKCNYHSDTSETDITECPQCHSSLIASINECYYNQCNQCNKCNKRRKHENRNTGI